MKKILYLGKRIGDVGGVTTFNKRFSKRLYNSNVDFKFLELTNISLLRLIKEIILHKNIYYSGCNIIFSILLRFFSIISYKKLIISFHGMPFNTKSLIVKTIENLSYRISHLTILGASGELQITYKKNIQVISSFISPANHSDLFVDNFLALNNVNKFEHIFVTMAYRNVIDKDGYELYGISNLIESFKMLENYALIVVNPNQDLIAKEEYKNIFFISQNINLSYLLEKADVFIRNTTSDGDPLSVKEALSVGCKVMASNCILRPESVHLFDYHDKNSLINTIKNICKADKMVVNDLDSYNEYLQIFKVFFYK